MIRYEHLYNFPQEIVDFLFDEYHKVFSKDEDRYTENPERHDDAILRYKGQELDIPGYPELNWLSFFNTIPNGGMSVIHHDLGRNFCINIPLQVHPEKGAFLCLKEGLWGTKVTKDDIINGSDYEYVPEYYENVAITVPTFINNSHPHGFMNFDDKWRIMLSVGLNFETIEDAWEHCKKWK